MGNTEVEALLRQNLQQEEKTAKHLETTCCGCTFRTPRGQRQVGREVLRWCLFAGVATWRKEVTGCSQSCVSETSRWFGSRG
jgi:hypothetical protein